MRQPLEPACVLLDARKAKYMIKLLTLLETHSIMQLLPVTLRYSNTYA